MMKLKGMVGAVTAITGLEKGSGKTTFLGYALPIARRYGPVAVFTIGVDGAQKARDSQPLPPEIRVEPGDVVMTTKSFARASMASFEVLEAIPGRGTLGSLFLGRALRGGSVTLVGSEHLGVLAEVISLVRREALAHSVIVDGAVNRLTQVSALGELNFVYTARVDPSNLSRAAARIRSLAVLASLPVQAEPGNSVHRIDGPFTADRLATLPKGVQRLSIDDFTKIFLDVSALTRVLARFDISVRKGFSLLGFAVTLRDVTRTTFVDAIGEAAASRLIFNPYEVAC